MFLSLGYKSVTMDDIANELNISKKTIYQHFANKQELVEASAKGLLASIKDGINQVCDEGHDPVEEFFYIRKFIIRIRNSETASAFYQLKKYYPEVSHHLMKFQFEEMNSWMINNLEKGIAAGVYRSDLNVDFVSRIYFVVVTGTKDTTIFPEDKYPHDEISRDYINYHLRAIITDKGLPILNYALETLI